MKRHAPQPRGFTLIEMLVVIAIVSALMAISAGAFVRYYINARQRATESVLQILDDQLGQRIDSFWRRVNPPIKTRHAVMAGLGITNGGMVVVPATNETQAVRLRRANLLAKLEAMRGDFPQQFADFLPGSAGGLATCTDTASPMSDNASAVASRTRAAIEQEYRRLTFEKNPTAVPNNNSKGAVTQIAPHNHWTESAACLYLMLKVGSGEGRAFDFSLIPPRHIQDTDGDGVPEIVDAWGTPIRFYRWPTDLIQSLTATSNQIGGNVNVLDAYNQNNQNTLDPEKLLYSTAWIAASWSQDFEKQTTANRLGMGNYFWVSDHVPYLTTPPPPPRKGYSFPIYPLLVSAGPDALTLAPDDRWQAFGLVWGDTVGSQPTAAITTSWPPVSDTYTRSGKIADEQPYGSSYPGAGMHVDNIFSRVIVAGREAQ